MIKHEILINEVIGASYKALDIKLKKSIYELFAERDDPVSEEVIRQLLPLWWASYSQWN